MNYKTNSIAAIITELNTNCTHLILHNLTGQNKAPHNKWYPAAGTDEETHEH